MNIDNKSTSQPVAVADDSFATSVLAGLRQNDKMIESKWLYDQAGSKLFDDITGLAEYYPTRVETGILQNRAHDLASYSPADGVMIELGSGASVKTRLLLDALDDLETYVPVDISEGHLRTAADHIASLYPSLKVVPVVADFTETIDLPSKILDREKLLFFPGSTIGNFEVEEARTLLAGLREMEHVSALIIGFDLVKDKATLVRAYDDELGVTADFNLNLLKRINRVLGADFALDAFHHEARWNEKLSRIEMHLVSNIAQQVSVLGETIVFSKGETIHTENSHKYTAESFKKLAADAGWQIMEILTDDQKQFAVAVLAPA